MNRSVVAALALVAVLMPVFGPPVVHAQINISTLQQLQDVNGNLSGNYVLANDIDASDPSGLPGGVFVPIGTAASPFTGTFDGNGHVIGNLTINTTATRVGLFGEIGVSGGDSGSLQNIVLQNISVTGTLASSQVGGLVGKVESGTISACATSGTVTGNGTAAGGLVGVMGLGTISESFSSAVVNGAADDVGGLVGLNGAGSISNCYATGAVTGSGDSAGGLVGFDLSEIYNNCYSTGSVSGSADDAGGLVGFSFGSAGTDSCYWDTQTSGMTESAIGTGKTTAKMMQQATFAGWDFTSVWSIEEGLSYPELQAFTDPPAPEPCVPDNKTLCLNGGRFKVQLDWLNQYGVAGKGKVAPAGSDDSGIIYFDNPSNWEMLVKVLDGCGFNNRIWVFYAATTDQAFTLTVTDTRNGRIKRYYNTLKNPADAVTDTAAFASCPADIAAAGALPAEDPPISVPYVEIIGNPPPSVTPEAGACVENDTVMCLNSNRFQVEVDWKSEDGKSGRGQVVPHGTDDSGMFWFFSASNWEMLIKVLYGCEFNDHYWVFFAATTDQEFTVTVTDTFTDEVKQYTNPMKHPADAITDTSAFATCQ